MHPGWNAPRMDSDFLLRFLPRKCLTFWLDLDVDDDLADIP